MTHSFNLPFSFRRPVIAFGADTKTAYAVLAGGRITLSEVFGDLKEAGDFERFSREIIQWQKKLKTASPLIACDMHPEYASARYARSIFSAAHIKEIQHHHGHIASCMAEAGLDEKVIGVAFDGTGYGADSNIWGGEFIVADYLGFQRAGHLEYMPMPGAEKAVSEPVRMAFSYLYNVFGNDVHGLRAGPVKRLGKQKCSFLADMIDKKINSPMTSSAGRLFDAVSSLVISKDAISSDGEAAIELEKIASKDCRDAYKFNITGRKQPFIVSFALMIKGIMRDLRQNRPKAVISRRFHNTVAEAIACVSAKIRENTGLKSVALSGGVFQNKILASEAEKRLAKKGFLVYTHSLTSCADKSLALGQAVIAGCQAAPHKRN